MCRWRQQNLFSFYKRSLLGNSLEAKPVEYQCQKTNFVKETGFPLPQKSSRLFDSHAFLRFFIFILSIPRTEHGFVLLFRRRRKNRTKKQKEIVKCHPYLWLAPHLPLVPCLNPQSACYIYIVMRTSLLTKHFLFDCIHTKKKSLQITLTNSSGKFQWIFFFFSSSLGNVVYMIRRQILGDFSSPSSAAAVLSETVFFLLFFLLLHLYDHCEALDSKDTREFMTKFTSTYLT